jgi:hypothetical protein
VSIGWFITWRSSVSATARSIADACAEEGMGRHVGIERRAFGQVADAAFRFDRFFLDIVPAHDRGAGRRGQEAGHHLHGGRLARAVRTEESEHLPLGDGERDVVHGQDRAESLGQRLNFEHPLSL